MRIVTIWDNEYSGYAFFISKKRVRNNWGQSKIKVIQSCLSKINKVIHGKVS